MRLSVQWETRHQKPSAFKSAVPCVRRRGTTTAGARAKRLGLSRELVIEAVLSDLAERFVGHRIARAIRTLAHARLTRDHGRSPQGHRTRRLRLSLRHALYSATIGWGRSAVEQDCAGDRR